MIIFLVASFAISGTVLSIFAALTIIYRPRKQAPARIADDIWPLVSLLKPVKDIDDDMEKNLESFYRLDYPRFEILFAVDRLTDPCVEVIESLEARYPDIPTTIMVTGHDDLENPKIHKLVRLEKRSQGNLLWITDSNVRVEKNTLTRLVSVHLKEGARIVFSPIKGSGSLTFASLMENSYLNFFASGSIISAWKLLRRQILVGKSFLIEERALESFGGFDYFRSYLAEDFLLGESFSRTGFRVSTNYTWVTNVSRRSSAISFFRRMARWATLRYHLKRPIYILEVLLNPVALGLFSLPFLGFTGLWVLTGVALLKIGLEYLNFVFVNTEDRSCWRWHVLFPAAVLVKDIILFGVYLYPFLTRRVKWRAGYISIGKMTLIRHPSNVDNPVYEGA
jgi:ceramide glucosyltransferase